MATAPAPQASQTAMPELPMHVQQMLSAQLLAFKIQKIFSNPIIVCYRKQFRALEDQRMFLAAHPQH